MDNDPDVSLAISHRFAQWTEDLEARGATPILALGITHEGHPDGETCYVLAAPDLDLAEVRRVLCDALICLRERGAVRRDPP